MESSPISDSVHARRRGAGFTLIEILVAMTIMGLLANLVIPATVEMRRRAEGASILGDHGAIRTAILDYYAKTGELPATAAIGTVPAELAASLPNGFTFRPHNASYVWVSYPSPIVILGQSTVGIIGVVCDDAKLASALAKTYKGKNVFHSGSVVLFFLG